MSKGNDSSSSADLSCDVLVLGAGPGGYTAAFRAADLGNGSRIRKPSQVRSRTRVVIEPLVTLRP